MLSCSVAVVTVPLGVLKSRQIYFSPPLPSWKEQAIRNLGFGLLNKLVLVFNKPFWDTTTELFGYVGGGKDGPASAAYDLNRYRSSRGKFYMFWNCMVVSGLPVLGKDVAWLTRFLLRAKMSIDLYSLMKNTPIPSPPPLSSSLLPDLPVFLSVY
jgi:hypothetical protein